MHDTLNPLNIHFCQMGIDLLLKREWKQLSLQGMSYYFPNKASTVFCLFTIQVGTGRSKHIFDALFFLLI